MKITKIAKMGKEDKFAVFIDDKLALIINGESLLNSDINTGQNLSPADLDKLNESVAYSKLYNLALKYISLRVRTEDEVRFYLKRKSASDIQSKEIISRLKELDLINDDNYVRAYIHDKLMLSPSSKRKITYELRKKKIAEDVIERSLENDQISDMDNLNKIITLKRLQPKFQDNLKLMQYLVRNGFNYYDVKQALKDTNNGDDSWA